MLKQFKHDCDKCIYRGSEAGLDYYTCDQHRLGDTYIARWGNGGADYSSVPALAHPGTLPDLADLRGGRMIYLLAAWDEIPGSGSYGFKTRSDGYNAIDIVWDPLWEERVEETLQEKIAQALSIECQKFIYAPNYIETHVQMKTAIINAIQRVCNETGMSYAYGI